jgi:hypothetical protein
MRFGYRAKKIVMTYYKALDALGAVDNYLSHSKIAAMTTIAK